MIALNMQGVSSVDVDSICNFECMLMQSIEGVCHIKEGQNPATWMLEISTPYAEEKIGKDFADIYTNSDLYK